jgi:membrane complex biogenesis BtpA family protein
VARDVELPIGINVLRNDARSALAIASAVGGRFIRVNVLVGMMYTDQGPIVGEAAEVARLRASLCPDVEIWADVMVKHAVPPPGSDITRLAGETVNRGLADAVIVSGTGTGSAPDPGDIAAVRAAVATRVVVGSGATVENLEALTADADTVIVGSSVEVDGRAGNRVDPARAVGFTDRARTLGLI